jgi:predicted metal-dependent phosphotriesterase family hydrolase
MGQVDNPLHPDGLVAMFDGLKKEGITDTEINRMAKENPARLLGLE